MLVFGGILDDGKGLRIEAGCYPFSDDRHAVVLPLREPLDDRAFQDIEDPAEGIFLPQFFRDEGHCSACAGSHAEGEVPG